MFWHSRDDDDSLAVVDEGLVVPEAGGGGIPTDGRNNAAAGAGIDQCLHFDGKLTKTFLLISFIEALGWVGAQNLGDQGFSTKSQGVHYFEFYFY